MAWNGSGTFSRTNGVNTGSTLWDDDKTAGTKIRSDRHDTHDQDLATGINNCLCKDGQNSPTADIDFNSNKLTSLAAGSAAGHSVRYEQVPKLDTVNKFSASNYWIFGSDVASATTVTLGTDGNAFHITGTTTITDFTHITNGDGPFFLIFDSALTLTYSGTVLDLPGDDDITTVAGDTAILIQDGTVWRIINYQENSTPNKFTYGFGDYILLTDTKTSGTSGGNSSAATSHKRDLAEDTDSGNHCSVSSSVFTLAAGTYIIQASAPAYQVGKHQTRLRNTSDGATTLVGSTEQCGTDDQVQSRSTLSGLFTIAASKDFEFQHYIESAVPNGLGYPATSGYGEVYSIVELWKIA